MHFLYHHGKAPLLEDTAGMWIFDAAHTIRRSIPAIRFRCYLA
jgi:hypothetical protein